MLHTLITHGTVINEQDKAISDYSTSTSSMKLFLRHAFWMSATWSFFVLATNTREVTPTAADISQATEHFLFTTCKKLIIHPLVATQSPTDDGKDAAEARCTMLKMEAA